MGVAYPRSPSLTPGHSRTTTHRVSPLLFPIECAFGPALRQRQRVPALAAVAVRMNSATGPANASGPCGLLSGRERSVTTGSNRCMTDNAPHSSCRPRLDPHHCSVASSKARLFPKGHADYHREKASPLRGRSVSPVAGSACPQGPRFSWHGSTQLASL